MLGKIEKNFFFRLLTRTFAAAFTEMMRCSDGGIGRRVGLKHQWGNTRVGSTPTPSTTEKAPFVGAFFHVFYKDVLIRNQRF